VRVVVRLSASPVASLPNPVGRKKTTFCAIESSKHYIFFFNFHTYQLFLGSCLERCPNEPKHNAADESRPQRDAGRFAALLDTLTNVVPSPKHGATAIPAVFCSFGKIQVMIKVFILQKKTACTTTNLGRLERRTCPFGSPRPNVSTAKIRNMHSRNMHSRNHAFSQHAFSQHAFALQSLPVAVPSRCTSLPKCMPRPECAPELNWTKISSFKPSQSSRPFSIAWFDSAK